MYYLCYALDMHVYLSGIGGVGIGPLAMICHDAGFQVSGSDAVESPMTELVAKHGISVAIGQDGSQISEAHKKTPIDWLVISSAVPTDHPEVLFAKQHNIPITKRDGMINEILRQKSLKLIGISGTHGKTTTTAMIVWLAKRFNHPISYSIGTSISFGPSGAYQAESEYFVYECDEYDRNMLAFRPFLSAVTTVDYDHPDTYPTPYDYDQAFRKFAKQSEQLVWWKQDIRRLSITHPRQIIIDEADPEIAGIALAGQHNREDAWQAVRVFCQLFPKYTIEQTIKAIGEFPGTSRRFERLAPNLYTSYDHHPREIKAALQLAHELNDRVVVVYQPHQNLRQHAIRDAYADCFTNVDHLYWLPTYLSREDKTLSILTPAELIQSLDDPSIAKPATLNDALFKDIQEALQSGSLVLCLGAGDIDAWIRQKVSSL
jgi:UDP-N-acetylmuramate--alanine ligase